MTGIKKMMMTKLLLAQQPLVGPGLLCPLVSVQGDFLPILDP